VGQGNKSPQQNLGRQDPNKVNKLWSFDGLILASGSCAASSKAVFVKKHPQFPPSDIFSANARNDCRMASRGPYVDSRSTSRLW